MDSHPIIDHSGIQSAPGENTFEYDISDQNGHESIEDIGGLRVSRVQTGHITPEMVREAIDRIQKGEIHRPQWTVSPELYKWIKEKIDTE
jgi:hypothetical protein